MTETRVHLGANVFIYAIDRESLSNLIQELS
jgi:hypothetical protein